jgi:uncharacterized protein YuzE
MDVRIEYDSEADATYVYLADEQATLSTVALSDVVNVDVDESEQPFGVEFLVRPAAITSAMIELVRAQFPAAADQVVALLTAVRSAA